MTSNLREWNIRNAAVLEFASDVEVYGTLPGQRWRQRVVRDVKKVQKVNRLCDQFFSAMESDSPYQTDEDAIQALAPIAVWFFGWAARQFAIAVLRWLWNRWHEDVPRHMNPVN